MRPDAIVFSGFPGAVQNSMLEEWYKRQKFAAWSGLSAEASAELVQGHWEAVLHAIAWRKLKQLMEDIDVAAVIFASCKAMQAFRYATRGNGARTASPTTGLAECRFALAAP